MWLMSCHQPVGNGAVHPSRCIGVDSEAVCVVIAEFELIFSFTVSLA